MRNSCKSSSWIDAQGLELELIPPWKVYDGLRKRMLLHHQTEIPLAQNKNTKECNLSGAFSVLSIKSKMEEVADGKRNKGFDMLRRSYSSKLYPCFEYYLKGQDAASWR